jgi:hypothetical protein
MSGQGLVSSPEILVLTTETPSYTEKLFRKTR